MTGINVRATWTREDNTIYYGVKYKDKFFIATAVCHPGDDFDEARGVKIAQLRAELKVLAHIRDNEIIPQLQFAEHIENSIATRETKTRTDYVVYRAANRLREDLHSVRETIIDRRGKLVKTLKEV